MDKNVSVILLAAGKSSRFWPLNYRHKSLFKILGKSILEHLLDELSQLALREIIIVSSPNDKNYIRKLIDNYSTMLDFKVAVQDEPLGMWDAILRGADLAEGDNYIVLNAHKLNVKGIVRDLIKAGGGDPVLAIKETDRPELFGVVKLVGGKIVDVIEKPPRERAPSNLRIVGVYRFNKQFLDYMEDVAEEEESEYKLEYALSRFARERGLRFIKVDDEPLSLRFPWDVLNYLKFLLGRIKVRSISREAKISSWAVIEGPIIIEEGAEISRHTSIVGPAYIGKNTFVGDGSIVRQSDLEEGSVVGAHFEIARSILQEKASTHSGYMGDSVVGEGTKIGAGFITANVRLDRKTVKCYVKGDKIDTGLRKLGVIIGRETSIGIHVGTMPGVFIGNRSIIGPGVMVYRNVGDGEKLFG